MFPCGRIGGNSRESYPDAVSVLVADDLFGVAVLGSQSIASSALYLRELIERQPYKWGQLPCQRHARVKRRSGTEHDNGIRRFDLSASIIERGCCPRHASIL